MVGSNGYGHGYGYGYGHGYGYGYSDGYGFGHGYGDGYGDGDYGDYGDPLPPCGGHRSYHIAPWGLLRVGCEIHSLDYWIEHAEEIDEEYGDGIADETRALALQLKETHENPLPPELLTAATMLEERASHLSDVVSALLATHHQELDARLRGPLREALTDYWRERAEFRKVTS